MMRGPGFLHWKDYSPCSRLPNIPDWGRPQGPSNDIHDMIGGMLIQRSHKLFGAELPGIHDFDAHAFPFYLCWNC